MLISYIGRNTIAILAPVILRENHLSAEQYGFIISCFSVADIIGNPAMRTDSGPLGSAVRNNYRCRDLGSGVGSACLSANGFWNFGIARAVLRADEGATFPGGLRTVTHTLSPVK